MQGIHNSYKNDYPNREFSFTSPTSLGWAAKKISSTIGVDTPTQAITFARNILLISASSYLVGSTFGIGTSSSVATTIGYVGYRFFVNDSMKKQTEFLEAAQHTCQNWHIILTGLEVNENEIEYLRKDAFINSLTDYLIQNNYNLDSLTSKLLKNPDLAEDLNLDKETKAAFQGHSEHLYNKKQEDLQTFSNLVYESTDQLNCKKDTIKCFALNKCELSFLSEGIRKLTGLTTLSVMINQLTYLPQSIGQLTKLTNLIAAHNQLTDLPETIGELAELQELNLSNNQLHELPPEIGNLKNLQTLRLSYNQLTNLPETIGELTKLKILNLQNNNFSEEAQENIQALLPNCRIVF